jgi:ornithine carbamoyltransferase
MRNLLTLFDLTSDTIRQLFVAAAKLKAGLRRGQRPPLLERRVLGLIFEKPSLRTRASFEAGMAQLGGSSIFLSANDGALGQREPVPDFARALSEYVDAVVLRVYRQSTIEEFARFSRVPVINGLSDYHHPCQALTDLFTVQELLGEARGKTLVFVGDGNNVARSLAVCCAHLGTRFVLTAPAGYGFDKAFVERYRQQFPRGDLTETGDPKKAVASADVVYTDVWTSMGQEAEHKQRLKKFAGFQINAALLARSPAHAKVLHCLPAHRGEEISDEAIEGPRSVVWEQAANRMHLQKALLVWCMS